MRRGAQTLAVSVALFLLSSCSTPTSQPAPTTNSIAARVQSHCTDVAAPSLGPGTLCISNGFKINRDNFSFANWGRSQRADDNVTAQTLIDLFGYDAVCAPGPQTECLLRPQATQQLELWNTALAGGRCEGLAALSTRLYLSLDSTRDFGNKYWQTAQLTRRSGDINESLVYWWTTQFAREVSRSAADSRRKTPLELVDQLITGLAQSIGYTIGLYFQSQGHAVTPFAVTSRDDNFVIHVYDNNFPKKRREIFVNKSTNTWFYPGASTSIDGAPIDWGGETGSFELTSMTARQGPFKCFFCQTYAVTEDAPSIISIASRDPNNPGYVRITSRDGVAEFSPSGFTTTIDGASIEMGKAGRGLSSIQLPSSVQEFDVVVTPSSPDSTTGDVVLSIVRPGFSRLQLSGNLAEEEVSGSPAPIVIARKKTTAVSAPPHATVDISLSQNGTLVTQELLPNEEFEVRKSTPTEIEVSVKGSTPRQTLMIPVAGMDNSQVASISRDTTNNLEVSVTSPTSVRSRRQRTVNFVPRKDTPRPTTTTITTLPSIEISEPD